MDRADELPDNPMILDANLRALEVHSPGLADRIRSAPIREDLRFVVAADGGLAGEIQTAGGSLRLCSFHAPLEEARRIAEQFDPKSAAVAVVFGFGLGHHARAIAERLKGQGSVVVIEPDLALLRAVLGRIDCSGWIIAMNVRVHADIEDQTSVSRAFEGLEGLLSVGMKIIDHPPSRTRLAPLVNPFLARLTTVVTTLRTHIITTLCQVGKTVGHYLSNAGTYATSGGVEDLRDIGRGRPAIVVSAGPSFARNVDLLSRPGIRDRVVIIAAQTVLKPLLARGIKPHFVTALDHADISKRFFEGLTEDDVRGVTLIIEPKANPAIPAAFPGEIRCTAEAIIDSVLGPKLAKPMGTLPSGSTVAHLSYYFARHLGCDPVILVGQDLGFTDGQYYAAGAAIHQVWSGELNSFNTLEMLEWQRIVRMKRMLHKSSDHLGRDVYTDEQMLAYRLQFERDFGEDRAKGLRVIDATEGGVRKEHTTILTLADALDAYAGPDVDAWSPPAPADPDGARGLAVLGRLRTLREDAQRIKSLCNQTDGVLVQMAKHVGDHRRVNPLITRAQELGTQADKIGAAYKLVQYVNQTGQLKRYRRDRLIALSTTEGLDRQRQQIERDRENMRWLADAAEELTTLTDRAIDHHRGIAREDRARDQVAAVTGTPGPKASARVGAVLAINPSIGGLASPRDLAADLAGKTVLARTVERLLASPSLDIVVLVTHEPDRTREILGTLASDRRVAVLAQNSDPLADRRRSIAAARRWSASCWRGGVGNMSVFDEAFAPAATIAAMDAHNLDAAIIVGPDWPLIDSASITALTDRYRAAGGDTGSHQLMFAHAAPGLGVCLIERGPITEIVATAAQLGPFASIGALIGYVPFAPQLDPIGKPAVIAAPPAARDLGVRCIADTPWSLDLARAVYAETEAPTFGTVVRAAQTQIAASLPPASQLSIDLDTINAMDAAAAIKHASADHPALAVSIRTSRDLSTNTAWRTLADTAHQSGAMVHLRTPFDGGTEAVQHVLDAQIEVVSIDLLTTDPQAYESLTGRRTFEAAVRNTTDLSSASPIGPAGLPAVWVVPRITRRDGEYTRLEGFYDFWLVKTGACVIDALPEAIPGERIAPLPIPASAVARMTREIAVLAPADQTVLELKNTVATEAA